MCPTHRVPADAGPVWQHRIRISLTAGDSALAKDMLVDEKDEHESKSGGLRAGGGRDAGARGQGQGQPNTRKPGCSPVTTTTTRPTTTAMDEDSRRQDDYADNRTNRLPSFTEVLSRKTRPPVDLFMF